MEGEAMSLLIPTYIAYDTETGGIPDETSLLTAYFAILNKDFQLMSELDIAIKPDNDLYVVNAQGLGVNKINLVEHDKIALSQKEAASAIYDFLYRANPAKLKLIPIGHNVHYDTSKIIKNTLSKKSWDNFVGYRQLDTGTVALACQAVGLLGPDVTAGLESMCRHFNVINKGPHTAKGDTWATVEVLIHLLNLMKR